MSGKIPVNIMFVFNIKRLWQLFIVKLKNLKQSLINKGKKKKLEAKQGPDSWKSQLSMHLLENKNGKFPARKVICLALHYSEEMIWT